MRGHTLTVGEARPPGRDGTRPRPDSPAAPLELRRVAPDEFEEILPLLELFGNRRMSKDDWRRMLFEYPWADATHHRGYAFCLAGRPVGFLGAIFSRRRIRGRDERFCNFSSWIVEKEHRGASVLLVRPLLADLADHTVVGFTPVPTTCAVFARFGFRSFETHRRILLPMPDLKTARNALRGTFTSSRDALRRELDGDERALHRDLSTTRVHEVLLRRGDQRCYVVARVERYKRLPLAEVLYLTDRKFFFENRALAQVALWLGTGTPLVAFDERLAEGRAVPFSIRVPRARIYRPAAPDIGPLDIDGLYSELVMLRE